MSDDLAVLRRELGATSGWPSATAFDAGTDLAGRLLRKEEPTPAVLVQELETLYLQGDPEQRRFIVDVILEHAFEDEEVRAHFESWRERPGLAEAYEEAEIWAQPLREQRKWLLKLARRCAEEMHARGGEVVAVEPAPMGSEAVEIHWRRRPGDRLQTLVLFSDPETSLSQADDAMSYALDEGHWQESEFLDNEWWVAIPKGA